LAGQSIADIDRRFADTAVAKTWEFTAEELDRIGRQMSGVLAAQLETPDGTWITTLASIFSGTSVSLAELAGVSLWKTDVTSRPPVATVLFSSLKHSAHFSGRVVVTKDEINELRIRAHPVRLTSVTPGYPDTEAWGAAISAGEIEASEPFGVLAIHLDPAGGPQQAAVSMLHLLAQQVNQHLAAARALRRETLAVIAAKESERIQRETGAMLHHQIHNDATAILRQAEELIRLDHDIVSPANSQQILQIEAHAVRLFRRLGALPAYSRLAAEDVTRSSTDMRSIPPGSLRNMCTLLARVYSRLYALDRVAFSIDYASFDQPDIFAHADVDLVEEALTCLLDNAGKYAKQGVPVVIRMARLQEPDALRVALVVENQAGQVVRPEHVAHMKEKGWQSERARADFGLGGLGLWLADSCMRAQGGRLDIGATARGLTRISLVLELTSAA